MIRAVLLDIDGTLVDSNDAHARAWLDAFAGAGLHVAFDDVRRCIGMGGDKLMMTVADVDEESPKGQTISKRRREIFRSVYLPTIKSFPGTRELVTTLKAKGLRVVAASSAKKDELAPLLTLAGVEGMLDAATSSDDAEDSKPAPDIVVAALERADAKGSEAVMIGDTPYDIEAAGRAGAAAIAFRCGGWSDDDLQGAIAIYDGPWDLLARIDTSPFARGAT